MLTTPQTNPSMPDWARWTVTSDQARMDMEYLHGSGNSVDHWLSVAAAWKSEQTRLRDASPDPANYVPTPFAYPMPQRLIADWSSETLWFTIKPDAAYPEFTPMPTLDPYVKPVETKGITSGAQQQTAVILNMLAQILKDTAALKAKAGL